MAGIVELRYARNVEMFRTKIVPWLLRLIRSTVRTLDFGGADLART